MSTLKLSLESLFGYLALSAMSLGVVGCWGHPVERTLRGRWLGEGVEQVDDTLTAQATGWVRGTSLEFSGSTLTVSIPAEEPRSGKYKVERVSKNDVTVAVTRPTGAVDRLHLKLEDERGLRWMLGSGRAILMRREN
jgi:hypothetical protein